MTRPTAQVTGSGSDPAASAPSPRRAVFLIAFLTVLGAVGWRRGEYFSGSLDPVVVAKAAVSFLALTLALLAAQRGPRRRLGTGSLWLLFLVLAASVFGALTSGNLMAGSVIAVRVVVLTATVVLLLRAAPALAVLRGLMWSCGALAVVAAVTGLPTMADGRLAGGVPAIDPNELALLAGVTVVLLAWGAVLDRAGLGTALAAGFFIAIIWATGSRTGLLMLVLGVAVMLLHVRRARVGLVVTTLVLVAVGVVGVVTTGVVATFAERGGDGTSTLDSRFIAWRAALTWAGTDWQRLFGGGLSVKIIRVTGQYWQTQPLDSSWASLLVQTGLLGLAVAFVWSLWVVRGALHAPRTHRALFLGLGTFLLGRSLLESGLFDASPAFLLFLAVSLLAEGASRERLGEEEAAGELV